MYTGKILYGRNVRRGVVGGMLECLREMLEIMLFGDVLRGVEHSGGESRHG